MSPDDRTLIETWYRAVEEAVKVKPIIAKEQKLRKEVVAAIFPTPKEGTNKVELAEGWELKLTYKIDRKVDPTLIGVIRDTLESIEVNMDTIVELKPSLILKAYKALPEEARSIVDEALTIKPGSPSLEIIPPKAEA